MNRSGWVIPVLLIILIVSLVGMYTLPRFREAMSSPPMRTASEAVGAAPPPPYYEHPLLVPELAGIRPGMREDRVIAILGTPAGRQAAPDGAVLDYKGLSVTVSRGQVSFVLVTAAGWRTPAGLEVGQTCDELFKLYRFPDLSCAVKNTPTGERTRLYFSNELEFGVSEQHEVITAIWIRPSRPGPFAASSLIVDPTVDHPVFRRYGREYVALVPQAVRDAVDKYDPSFMPWRYDEYDPETGRQYVFSEAEAMFGVIGDFNGDRIPDVVMDGYTAGSHVTLGVLSEKGSYKAVEVDRHLNHDTGHMQRQYHLLVEPGGKARQIDNVPPDLATDAFKRCSYGKTEALICLKDGVWRSYVSGE